MGNSKMSNQKKPLSFSMPTKVDKTNAASVLGEFRNLLTKDELRRFSQKSTFWASWYFIFTWTMIAGCFALFGFYPGVVTGLIALVLLAGRQMALAVLMHETSHSTLFKSKWANEFFGQWFAAYPMLLDQASYRDYHLQHHRFTGQPADPDLVLVRFYPLSRKGLLRWMRNDLLGLVAIKQFKMQLGLRLGYIDFDEKGHYKNGPQFKAPKSKQLTDFLKVLAPTVACHCILFGALFFSGIWFAYPLWWVAQFTVFQAILRIRVIAEHGMTGRTSHMLHNTRTVSAAWWERLFFCPHNVNFHIEHHIFMGVPAYHLKKVHTVLKERGHLDDAVLAPGYFDVWKQASSRAA